MKILVPLLSLLLLFCNSLYAQKHDNIWIIGYPSGDSLSTYNSPFGITYFDFNYQPVKIYKKWLDLSYNETNTTISDKNGNMLFTTNMCKIKGKDGKSVKNGDTLLFNKTWYKYGIRAEQGVLALPMPANENQYFLIYGNKLIEYFSPIFSSIFDKTIGTNGGIIEKNKLILKDSFATGKITAVKHANGRDWWINLIKSSSTHYLFLLDPNGLKLHNIKKMGEPIREGVGQAVFSPDGTKYVFNNSVNKSIGQDVFIFDFDRCEGVLSNPYQMHFDSAAFSGIAISPNSRFLYFSDGWHVIQYDLQATDIKASETILATWDGLIDLGPTGFSNMQLGPDNRIYISTPGATSYMSYIEKPDLLGKACNVKQNSIKLPTYNSRSIPNHPNYRLGALKKSHCDTLKTINVLQNFLSKNIVVYPNPASQTLTIDIENSFIMEQKYPLYLNIHSASGELILLKTISNTPLHIIDISIIPSGFYLVSIRTEKQLLGTHRFVKID